MTDMKLSEIAEAIKHMIQKSALNIVPEDENDVVITDGELADGGNVAFQHKLARSAKEVGLDQRDYHCWTNLEEAINKNIKEEEMFAEHFAKYDKKTDGELAEDDDEENEEDEVDVEEEEAVQAYKHEGTVKHSVKVRTEWGYKVYYSDQDLVKAFIAGIEYQKKVGK